MFYLCHAAAIKAMENFIGLKLDSPLNCFAMPTKVKIRKKKERNECNGRESFLLRDIRPAV